MHDWQELRAVDLGFLESAPRRYEVLAELPAPLDGVWDAYVDPTTWSEWFPGVNQARYRGPGPHGVGSIREAQVGEFEYEEVMIAWEEQRHWAYYVSRCTRPLAHAQLESTEFEATDDGTRLRWIIAADPRPMLEEADPIFRDVMQSLFNRATEQLARRLG